MRSEGKPSGRITVTPEVEQALGIPAAKIARMSLRELAEVAYDKGYTWNVNSEPSDDPGLTVRVEKPKDPTQPLS